MDMWSAVCKGKPHDCVGATHRRTSRTLETLVYVTGDFGPTEDAITFRVVKVQCASVVFLCRSQPGRDHGPSTLALRASQRFVHRQLTAGVMIVVVIVIMPLCCLSHCSVVLSHFVSGVLLYVNCRIVYDC